MSRIQFELPLHGRTEVVRVDEVVEVEESEKPLSARETMVLAELERTIVKDFAAFYRVGKALAEINNLRLYRNKEGRTFEQYCKELWDISESRAYQFIDGSVVYEQLQICCENKTSTNCGGFENAIDISSNNTPMLPLNEAQIRPLTKFKDNIEQLKTIWNAAIDTAPNGKVTAAHIKKTTKQITGENVDKQVRKAKEHVAQEGSPAFSKTFNAFSDQIIVERKQGYKNTSRVLIIKHLDQLRAYLAEDGETVEDSVFRGGSNDANKLERAGFSLFRMDRSSMSIKQHNEKGSWVKYSDGYETLKDMEAAFKEVLLDDMHLVG